MIDLSLLAHELGHARYNTDLAGECGTFAILDLGDELAVTTNVALTHLQLGESALYAAATGYFYRGLSAGKTPDELLPADPLALITAVLSDPAVSPSDLTVIKATKPAPTIEVFRRAMRWAKEMIPNAETLEGIALDIEVYGKATFYNNGNALQ